MSNRITNKQKQAACSDHSEPPNRWMKLWTVRKLRREQLDSELEEIEPRLRTPGSRDPRALRKRHDRCPVCEAKLVKLGKKRRYPRRCVTCGAVHQKPLRCPSCGTHRVWAGRLGRWCRGCGRPFEA
ncbi:MAG: hypothetical protein AAGM22_18965 [Acidobacteriota bacterium]